MNRNNLTTAVIAGIAGVAGIANMASAVNLNPDGLGQVLLYPYYTVNANQQTLLSVVNTTAIGKAVKVRFLEGYNSREVLDFNLFLSPFDVWTASVFSLSDGNVPGLGAGIFSFDNSCTAPAFATAGLSNGAKYQAFLNFAYTGFPDTGPTDDTRTREGHFEMINMADIPPGSTLATDITHVAGIPPGCASAEADAEATTFVANTGGLFGAAAVVDGAKGSFYAYNADALDGFNPNPLFTKTGSLTPSLAQVNDANPATATSLVFSNGTLVTSVYPSATQAIDAVTSVFDASNIYNQYESAANGSSASDWVVTMPTKRFYVDPLYLPPASKAIAPFEHLFGAKEAGNGLGLSCTIVGISIFDREEGTSTPTGCGFSPCPPGRPPSSLCLETNVITFLGAGQTATALSSGLTSNITPLAGAGWAQLALTDALHNGQANVPPHAMRPSNAPVNTFYGLPITGFEAVRFNNSNQVGSKYGGVYRHRISRCADTAAVGACS